MCNCASHSVPQISLGLVPTGERTVSKIPARILSLVPKPEGVNENVKAAGADPIRDTVPLIKAMVKRQLWQGKKLAAHLKANSLEQTVRNNWDFIFRYIQYKKDPDNTEAVRSLRRLVYDAQGDCDCFTCGLSNLLLNQGIAHSLRVAKYNNRPEWSHIYIVVPRRDGTYITLDPVVHKFNYEIPFTEKKDFDMKLQSLDGFDGCACGCQSSSSNGGSGGSGNGGAKPPIRKLVPSKLLEAEGVTRTMDLLAKNGIVGQVKTADTITIQSSQGPVDLPALIRTKDAEPLVTSIKADQVSASVTETTQAPSESGGAVKASGGVLFGLLALSLGLSAMRPSSKPIGLSGPPRKKAVSVNM